MTRICIGPLCDKPALLWRKLCGGHKQQQSRYGKLAPLVPAHHGGPVVTPERMEFYRKVAEISTHGHTMAEMAAALNVRVAQLKHLRWKAQSHGMTVLPAARAHRPEEYRSMRDDERDRALVSRCRCGLALPCHNCLARNAAEHAERNMYRESP